MWSVDRARNLEPSVKEHLIENETSLFAWYEMLTAAREATSRELS